MLWSKNTITGQNVVRNKAPNNHLL